MLQLICIFKNRICIDFDFDIVFSYNKTKLKSILYIRKAMVKY